VPAFVSVIEFQKRGLPHAHIILWLHDKDRLDTPAKVDSFISAELPHPVYEPELHKLVVEHMIHGPCGEFNGGCRCMKRIKGTDRKRCRYQFPKPFAPETIIGDDGVVTYRRRDLPDRCPVPNVFGTWPPKKQHLRPDGSTTWESFMPNNQHVVPYNKALLMKFDCHVNVEVCTGIRLIKYLHKYVYKGPDRAKVRAVRNALKNRKFSI
jgi:hypothetical protein